MMFANQQKAAARETALPVGHYIPPVNLVR